MKFIADGNLTWGASVSLVIIGLAIMFASLKFAPSSPWSVIPLLLGFGVAAVGGMCSRARMLHIKPFDNSYKKARKSYEIKGDEQDNP
ncbi:hypothetical protein LMG28688_05522 [Paraburkholderia caffeinitolerans]|uniref:Uncharacterized protein n=1 Tax=Paraburkholderia caffeinitolerans TaxID=1723730 RepID=A0A6J5GRA6_9BURK|nr:MULTISPECIES: hypothetical protein [Paraburkholderia]CAB3802174.1 hypothetical protein LMG28688_05522 [Paraburkholderia caffeinitolerans]